VRRRTTPKWIAALDRFDFSSGILCMLPRSIDIAGHSERDDLAGR
jgi:hypothetical protein